jgi:hypothetical protein
MPHAMSGIARLSRSSMPLPTTSVRQLSDRKISSSVCACGVPRIGPLLNQHLQLAPHHVDKQFNSAGFHQIGERSGRDLETVRVDEERRATRRRLIPSRGRTWEISEQYDRIAFA